MPLFDVTLNSLDGQAKEKVEITCSKMPDFSVIKRPTLKELKVKYQHVIDKKFYMTANEQCPIHLILVDSTYCKIRTKQVFKGRPEDPIVEGTTFGWVIHGRAEYVEKKGCS